MIHTPFSATEGDTTVVSKTTGERILVYRLVATASATCAITWKSDSTGLSGAMTLVAGVPLILPLVDSKYIPIQEAAWLTTGAGEDLVLTVTGASTVSGWVTSVTCCDPIDFTMGS
jgi:hypothetical protein